MLYLHLHSSQSMFWFSLWWLLCFISYLGVCCIISTHLWVSQLFFFFFGILRNVGGLVSHWGTTYLDWKLRTDRTPEKGQSPILMKNRIFTKSQCRPTIFSLITKRKSNFWMEKSGRHTLNERSKLTPPVMRQPELWTPFYNTLEGHTTREMTVTHSEPKLNHEQIPEKLKLRGILQKSILQMCQLHAMRRKTERLFQIKEHLRVTTTKDNVWS